MYNGGCKATNIVEEASGRTDIKHGEIENKMPNAGALI
jgi:hypothetical protein